MNLYELASMFCGNGGGNETTGNSCQFAVLDNWKCSQPIPETSSSSWTWAVIQNVFLSNFVLSSCVLSTNMYLVNDLTQQIVYQETLQDALGCMTHWNLAALPQSRYDVVVQLPADAFDELTNVVTFGRVAPVLQSPSPVSTFEFVSSVSSVLRHTITFDSPPNFGGDCCAVNGYKLVSDASPLSPPVCSLTTSYTYQKSYPPIDQDIHANIQTFLYNISAMPCLWDAYTLAKDKTLPATHSPTLRPTAPLTNLSSIRGQAISASPTIAPTSSPGFSPGAIVGIVFGVIVGVCICSGLVLYMYMNCVSSSSRTQSYDSDED